MSSLTVANVFAITVSQLSTTGVQFKANTESITLLLIQASSIGEVISRFIAPLLIAVIVAIAISFAWACRSLLRYKRELPEEHEALGQVEQNYEKLRLTEEKNPDVIEKELLIGVGSNTAVAQRVRDLHSIRSYGGDLDQAPLAEVLATREATKISFAKYVSSILVLLGLCGAILGLSKLVFQMAPELRTMQESTKRRASTPNPANTTTAAERNAFDQSLDSLVKTMANSLEHTMYAFAASFLGIITSISLLYFNLRISSRQLQFLTELEDLTATKLIPIFKPPRELSELSEAVEAFKDASEYVSAVSTNLENTSTRVEKSMLDFDDIVFKFRTGTETLQQKDERINEAQATIEQLMKEFTAGSKNIEDHLSTSKKSIESIIKIISDSDKRFDRAIEEWRKNNETLLREIQDVSTKAAKQTQDAREETQKAIDGINQLIKESLTEQLKTLNDNCLAAFKKQQDLNQAVLRDIVQEQKNFVTELQGSVDGNGNREFIIGVNDFIKAESLSFGEVLEQFKQEREIFRNQIQKFAVAVKEPRSEAIYDELNHIKNILTDVKSDLRREREPTVVYTNQADTNLQQALLRDVRTLNHSFHGLNSMLRTVLCLIGFTLPVLGLLGLTRKFGLWWVADSISHEIYIGAIIAVGVIVAWLVVRISQPKNVVDTIME